MADQIGRNFATRPADEAVAGIAEHLERFWDPSMRRDLADAAAAGRVNVSAVVGKALESLS
ncbi:MAG: formate dehydrogenase subunit delta [Gammaproteobacteria bacterium]|nr:formate dehydrogenase subunit delta [Gammaproteobacteria bacterium]